MGKRLAIVAILVALASRVGVSQDTSRNVVFPDKVLSFETLDKVENYEELVKYGLVSPGQQSHNSGKNLILLALKATSFFKGDWVMCVGLLGTQMLDTDLFSQIGYRSTFLSGTHRSKMQASYQQASDNLLLIDREDKKPLRSLIARREAVIFGVSWELNGRFVYDRKGNFGKVYEPEVNRESNQKLKKVVAEGIKVYNEFANQGYKDKMLKDCLGIASATLEYDQISLDLKDWTLMWPMQIYEDALRATLDKLRKEPRHNYQILEELGSQMGIRGLSDHDPILFPNVESNHEALLKIVTKDLVAIKNK